MNGSLFPGKPAIIVFLIRLRYEKVPFDGPIQLYTM